MTDPRLYDDFATSLVSSSAKAARTMPSVVQPFLCAEFLTFFSLHGKASMQQNATECNSSWGVPKDRNDAFSEYRVRFVLVLRRARALKMTARKSCLNTSGFDSVFRPKFWGYATLPSRFRFRFVGEIGSCALDYDREKIASDHLQFQCVDDSIADLVCCESLVLDPGFSPR